MCSCFVICVKSHIFFKYELSFDGFTVTKNEVYDLLECDIVCLDK